LEKQLIGVSNKTMLTRIEVGEQSDFYYNAIINSKMELEEVHITIAVNYKKKGTTEDFMRGRTSTVFLIQQMKERSALKDGKEVVDLPDPLWVTLFSISFTHARAMLAHSSAGTKYGHMIMPLVNPETEFKKIFGKELKKQSGFFYIDSFCGCHLCNVPCVLIHTDYEQNQTDDQQQRICKSRWQF
jgi:hypothetical protein